MANLSIGALSPVQVIIIYGVLFVGVMLLVDGAFQLLPGGDARLRAKVNRRLLMLDSGMASEEVLQRLRRRRPTSDASNPIESLRKLIYHAGSDLSLAQLFMLMGGLGVLLLFGLRVAFRAPWELSLLVGLVMGAYLPISYLRGRRKRRLKAFSEQLPEAIDLIVRSLRAGHPLNSGLRMVAEELPDPIGTEFGLVVDEITYGLDLQQAIGNMSDRVPLPDLRYLVVSVRIQYGSGGNLAEILDSLSTLIRARMQMFRKVLAITSEGRLSAWFLSLFPIGMGAVLLAIKPDYYEPIMDDPLFPYLAGTAGGLLLLNIVVMRFMMNIKV